MNSTIFAIFINKKFSLQLEELRTKVFGKKKKGKDKRDVIYGAMKAMVSPESAEILKDISEKRKMSEKESIEKLDILIKFFKEEFRSWLNVIGEKK